MNDDQRDRLLTAAIVAFAAAALFNLMSRTAADPDLWGHVRFGQLIADLGAVPRVDPFAYTSGPISWINHEWLAELLFAGLYELGGPIALEGLKFALATVVFGAAAWHLHREGVGALGAAVLLLLAALPLRIVFGTVRPMLFTTVLLLVVLLLLRHSRDRTRLLWIVPISLALWVNLHGGVLAGLGVVAIWFGAQLVETRLGADQRRELSGPSASTSLAVGVASVAALLVNPYGWRLPAFLVETATVARPYITDWQPLDITSMYGALYLLTVGVGAALVSRSRRRLRLPEVVLSVVALLLPLLAVRHLALYAVVWLVVIAEPAADVWKQLRSRPRSEWEPGHPLLRIGAVSSLGVGAVALAISGFAETGCIKSSGEETISYPRDAVEYFDHTTDSRRLAVHFGWGEYVIWHLGPRVQVSIDGRRETVYSDSVYRSYLAFETGTGDWRRHIEEPAAELALVKRSGTSSNLLDMAEDWSRVFESSTSVLFARDELVEALPDPASIIERTAVNRSSRSQHCFPE
jgi:hypothetical protein